MDMPTVTRSIERILEFSGWLAKASALVLVGLVVANVLMRYFFSTGSVGLQELEWHLISPIALLGMSYSLHHGDHVRVDVFYERMRPSVQSSIDCLTAVLTVAVSLWLVWLAIPYVYSAYEMGQGSPDPGGLPHRFILKAFIPLGFSLLALQSVLALMHSITRLRLHNRGQHTLEQES